MKKLVLKHPRPIRWFHWINVPLLSIMIGSGILIYWANDVYRLRLGSWEFHFFPDGFYQYFGIAGKLSTGMAYHFAFMWLFALNGLLYVGYTLFSGEWRHLLPNRHSFREAFQVVLYDLRLSKVHPPRRKFNGAQQIAYTTVILMGGGSLLTGLAIYKPTQFAWLTWLCGGYEWARWGHFWLTVGYVVFFVIHITQVIKSGLGNFLAMVTGYEVEEVAEVNHEHAEAKQPAVATR